MSTSAPTKKGRITTDHDPSLIFPINLSQRIGPPRIAGKKITINYIPASQGMRGRNSDNRSFEKNLGWCISEEFAVRLRKTYPWIVKQVEYFWKDIVK
jgi:hypothetical protein